MKKKQQVNTLNHLRAPTKKWVQDTISEYSLEPHHERLLILAAEAFDRCTQARELLKKQGLTVATVDGGIKAHPAAGIVEAADEQVSAGAPGATAAPGPLRKGPLRGEYPRHVVELDQLQVNVGARRQPRSVAVSPAEREELDLTERANQILKLAAKAAAIWENVRSTAHRRDLLGVVASNCTWDGARLALELAEPFDALALLASEWEAAGPALAVLAEGEAGLVSQTLPTWNQLWGWLRELDELRKTPVEDGGFAAAAGF